MKPRRVKIVIEITTKISPEKIKKRFVKAGTTQKDITFDSIRYSIIDPKKK